MAAVNYDLIPFGAAMGGESPGTVRVGKEPIDGLRRLCLRDLIGVGCGKNNNDSGQIWRTLRAKALSKENSESTEMLSHVRDFKFDGVGQKTQPTISLQGAFMLLMMLPGEHAKRFRCATARVLLGYFAGDEALVAEIRANQAYAGLINEMAREELREARGGAAAPPPAAAAAAEDPSVEFANERERQRLKHAAMLLDNKVAAAARARREKEEQLADKIAAAERKRQEDARVQAAKAAALAERTAAAELKRKQDEAAAELKCKAAEAEQALRLEATARAKLSAVDTDNADRESNAKRRRIESEGTAERLARDAAMRQDPAAAIAALRGSLQGVALEGPEIAAHVRALLARLMPQAQFEQQQQPAEASDDSHTFFTVLGLVQKHPQLLRDVPVSQRPALLSNAGRKLVAFCAVHVLPLGNPRREGAFTVQTYPLAAEDEACSIVASLARAQRHGEAQPSVREMFARAAAP